MWKRSFLTSSNVLSSVRADAAKWPFSLGTFFDILCTKNVTLRIRHLLERGGTNKCDIWIDFHSIHVYVTNLPVPSQLYRSSCDKFILEVNRQKIPKINHILHRSHSDLWVPREDGPHAAGVFKYFNWSTRFFYIRTLHCKETLERF